ncbi:MAG TPA: hypothetical protein VFK05_23990 [Polyangiaceae bacterium]|nr:hypothetical protein [Polyangiaceae bacterium]
MRASGMWVLYGAVALAACGSADNAAPAGNLTASQGGSANIGNGASAGGSFSAGSASVPPPEKEEAQSYRAPVVSGRWVWTANPDTGKVAIIDAKSYSVRLADAGIGPTFLSALPSAANTSKALVINVGSNDATLLRADESGAVQAVGPIPLQENANAWTVSKTGKFALAWTDSHALSADPTENFQDLSVVDLRGSEPRATRLVVGLVPSRVFIDDAEQQAYVVAKSGLSVIDLASKSGPRVLREVALSDDPLHEDVSSRDVSVMPDGSYAFVRHEGSALITLVELATGALSSVTLSGPVTDLDLVSDAKSALAVVRGDAVPPPSDAQGGAAGDSSNDTALAGAGGEPDTSEAAGTANGGSENGGSENGGGENGAAASGSGGATNGGAASAGQTNGGAASAGATSQSGPRSTLAILPIPGIFSAPTSFESVSIAEQFGLVNIAPEGTAALLYTNAVASSHLTILETAPGANFLHYRTLDVHGIVRDVYPSPDGAYAIASLSAPRDAGGKSGFAAVPVASSTPVRVQTTDAPVFAVAQSAGKSPRAVVTVSDGNAKFLAYIVRMPELVVDSVQLPSRPLPGATGLVPEAGVAYIAQAHPQGRITFINLETGVPRTISGFELAAKVVNGR